ncbi:T9SS type A sorting domain-containing protein [bacterium]|nr:T9SS type A sorting domain-containing protein [bacterium]
MTALKRGALLLCVVFLLASPLAAMDGELVVHHDGTTTTIALDDVNSMSYNENDGVVIDADMVYNYPITTLEKITFENLTDMEEDGTIPLPSQFQLDPAYPNPFNSTVTVPMTLPTAGTLRIRLVNLLGQTVYHGEAVRQAGYHRVALDLSNRRTSLSSGVYLLRAEFEGQVQSMKLVFMK